MNIVYRLVCTGLCRLEHSVHIGSCRVEHSVHIGLCRVDHCVQSRFWTGKPRVVLRLCRIVGVESVMCRVGSPYMYLCRVRYRNFVVFRESTSSGSTGRRMALGVTYDGQFRPQLPSRPARSACTLSTAGRIILGRWSATPRPSIRPNFLCSGDCLARTQPLSLNNQTGVIESVPEPSARTAF